MGFYKVLDGGNGSGKVFTISDTAPLDIKVFWIDTANNGVAKYFNGAEWVAVTSVWG